MKRIEYAMGKKLDMIFMNKKWVCGKCGYEVHEAIKGICPNCKGGRLQTWHQCECGKWFHPKALRFKYCSTECGCRYKRYGGKLGKHYPDVRVWNKKDEIKKTCPVCNKVFFTTRENAVYCSKDCWSHRATLMRNCPECGKQFKTTKSENRKFCSRECRNLSYREYTGEKAHAWKGGTTKETKCRRSNSEYREWRMAVFTRDNFKCQICGKHGSDLEAHHIKEVRNYPDLIYDVDNGLTLCHECHKTTDNYANSAKKLNVAM